MPMADRKRWIVLAAIALLLMIWLVVSRAIRNAPHIERQSPDRRRTARLVEHERWIGWIDRNFEFQIIDNAADSTRTVFESPDEGAPPGTEQIRWTSDSRYVLVIGENFWVVEGSSDSEGKQLYLLYDIVEDRLWCNATQTSLPRFTNEKILELDFVE